MATHRNRSKPTKKTLTRTRPAGRTARQPSRPKPFSETVNDVGQDDLVLLGLDGKSLFWIKKKDYEKTRVPEKLIDQLRILTNQGTVVADVPRGSIPGVGSACFLVNLASIRKGSNSSGT